MSAHLLWDLGRHHLNKGASSKGLTSFTQLVKVRRVTWLWHFRASDFPSTVPSPLVTPVTPVVVVVSFSWGRHDFDIKSYSNGQDHGDHGGNDDNDLYTSHDQQEKEGADRGLQFPT